MITSTNKRSVLVLLMTLAWLVVTGATSIKDKDGNSDRDEMGPFQIKSSKYKGCIEPRKGRVEEDITLILGDCSDPELAWKMDQDGRIHTFKNDKRCLTVGRGNNMKDGAKMRIFRCNKDRKDQVFEFESGGPLRLKGKKNLCVVFLGAQANVGKDPIIFKECNAILNPSDCCGRRVHRWNSLFETSNRTLAA